MIGSCSFWALEMTKTWTEGLCTNLGRVKVKQGDGDVYELQMFTLYYSHLAWVFQAVCRTHSKVS